MLEWLSGVNGVILALFAGIFTWGMTAFGAALVFFFKSLNQRITNLMLGFAAGVMIAASFWSLLDPAIERSAHLGRWAFMPALIGFLVGGAFLFLLDKCIPHLHLGLDESKKEGPKTKLNRNLLLVISITIHNIPEGLALGVCCGAIMKGDKAGLVSAIALALGIGIQNYPEGAAVSIPLRSTGMSRAKSFWYGQLSAVVEPIFSVIGALLVIQVTPILPYALAFAAGAMIFVVVEELIPESQAEGGSDLATVGCLVGFGVMMALDVALG